MKGMETSAILSPQDQQLLSQMSEFLKEMGWGTGTEDRKCFQSVIIFSITKLPKTKQFRL